MKPSISVNQDENGYNMSNYNLYLQPIQTLVTSLFSVLIVRVKMYLLICQM